jgi:hypothetical protein
MAVQCCAVLTVVAVSFVKSWLIGEIGSIGTDIESIVPNLTHHLATDADELVPVHVSKNGFVRTHRLFALHQDEPFSAFHVRIRTPHLVRHQERDGGFRRRKATKRSVRLQQQQRNKQQQQGH